MNRYRIVFRVEWGGEEIGEYNATVEAEDADRAIDKAYAHVVNAGLVTEKGRYLFKSCFDMGPVDAEEPRG